MIIKRDIQIEKLDEEKKLLVKVYIEDKLTPEEALKMLESRKQILDQSHKDIDAIPTIVAERTKALNQQLEDAQKEYDQFIQVEASAKEWAAENELKSHQASQPQ